jgi:hypothetical protein
MSITTTKAPGTTASTTADDMVKAKSRDTMISGGHDTAWRG